MLRVFLFVSLSSCSRAVYPPITVNSRESVQHMFPWKHLRNALKHLIHRCRPWFHGHGYASVNLVVGTSDPLCLETDYIRDQLRLAKIIGVAGRRSQLSARLSRGLPSVPEEEVLDDSGFVDRFLLPYDSFS
jgi:hypothetical protein